MLSPGWAAAAVSFAALAGTFAGSLWRGGRRDGKIDAVLDQLTRIVEDHEVRLRAVERSPRHARQRGR